jgi:hypothetical protein
VGTSHIAPGLVTWLQNKATQQCRTGCLATEQNRTVQIQQYKVLLFGVGVFSHNDTDNPTVQSVLNGEDTLLLMYGIHINFHFYVCNCDK